jgi:hypothetical protein
MPLRLRITGEGLRITGPSPGPAPARPPLPAAGVLLVTENGDLLVTEQGEHLVVESSDGQ